MPRDAHAGLRERDFMSLKSAAGEWNDSYKLAGHDTAPKPYGDNTTYLKGADFSKACVWKTGVAVLVGSSGFHRRGSLHGC